MKKGKSTKKKLEPFEIGELDQYLFGQGNHYEIYEKMGAHKVTYKGQEGVYFAVWAPNARRVAVVGDFNGWDFEANYMERQEPVGIYTCFVRESEKGICINSVLRLSRENVSLRRIHLPITQNSDREQLPG